MATYLNMLTGGVISISKTQVELAQQIWQWDAGSSQGLGIIASTAMEGEYKAGGAALMLC